jgi:hypothetical protein
MSSPGGSRVRLVCTSCKTLCEVTIPAANPTSTKPVRYQVRCPSCKAINEPQNPLRAGAGKAVDPKRKVCLARATLSLARRAPLERAPHLRRERRLFHLQRSGRMLQRQLQGCRRNQPAQTQTPNRAQLAVRRLPVQRQWTNLPERRPPQSLPSRRRTAPEAARRRRRSPCSWWRGSSDRGRGRGSSSTTSSGWDTTRRTTPGSRRRTSSTPS